MKTWGCSAWSPALACVLSSRRARRTPRAPRRRHPPLRPHIQTPDHPGSYGSQHPFVIDQQHEARLRSQGALGRTMRARCRRPAACRSRPMDRPLHRPGTPPCGAGRRNAPSGSARQLEALESVDRGVHASRRYSCFAWVAKFHPLRLYGDPGVSSEANLRTNKKSGPCMTSCRTRPGSIRSPKREGRTL